MNGKTELTLEIEDELMAKLQDHAAKGGSIQRIVEAGIKMWFAEKELDEFMERRNRAWEY